MILTELLELSGWLTPTGIWRHTTIVGLVTFIPFQLLLIFEYVNYVRKSSLGTQARMDAINKSNAIIEFDKNRRIVFANATFCKLCGYNEEELKGRDHRILVRPEYAESVEYREFWETLLAGKHLQSEYERVKKDGSSIWLHATYNPVFDKEGKLIRILKIATDVSEAVNHRRQIEIQRKQFSELLNFVDEAAIV
ncbi:MAG: PAS domain-containing protein, partial [Bacteroidota bacterium]